MFGRKASMVDKDKALPGRSAALPLTNKHYVSGQPMRGPYSEGLKTAVFALGCFWGAERCFWQLPGVHSTAVGYAGGYTPNPEYDEVCSGLTGHTEVVLVVYDPKVVTLEDLLVVFWQSHDPTQGLRQGNDVGSQYRSAIYLDEQSELDAARESMQRYQAELSDNGYGAITTELALSPDFYFAEDYHQQYLAKNPGGYCGLGGTGVSCPK